jgi:RNA polymerase sigma factor (sigma-70 family)
VHRSDPQLIHAACSGDQGAWDELVERYSRLIYSIPRRYGLSEADSDDVFQAVMATVFTKLETLRDQTRLSAWLITTTHRESWRVGKKSGKYAQLDAVMPDVGSPGEQDLERWEQQHMVREGLRRLGGRCEELLSALFLEPGEPSYEAIAQRMNMSLGSIGPTRARCFKKLEAILLTLGFEAPAGGHVAQAS